MVIHYLTIFLQEAGVWSSSLDSKFRDILKKIDDLVIRDETKARIDFENKECFRAVQAWKAHLLRSVNQEEVKQNALTQLDEESSLIIMDWAMKYLPQHCLKSYIWVTYIMRQKQVKSIKIGSYRS